MTYGHHRFRNADGQTVDVSTFSPAGRPTMTLVTLGAELAPTTAPTAEAATAMVVRDRNAVLAVFNGVKDVLDLPIAPSN